MAEKKTSLTLYSSTISINSNEIKHLAISKGVGQAPAGVGTLYVYTQIHTRGFYVHVYQEQHINRLTNPVLTN